MKRVGLALTKYRRECSSLEWHESGSSPQVCMCYVSERPEEEPWAQGTDDTSSARELTWVLGPCKCSARMCSGSRMEGGRAWEENSSTLALSLKSDYSNDNYLEADTMFDPSLYVPGTFPRPWPLVEPQQILMFNLLPCLKHSRSFPLIWNKIHPCLLDSEALCDLTLSWSALAFPNLSLSLITWLAISHSHYELSCTHPRLRDALFHQLISVGSSYFIQIVSIIVLYY